MDLEPSPWSEPGPDLSAYPPDDRAWFCAYCLVIAERASSYITIGGTRVDGAGAAFLIKWSAGQTRYDSTAELRIDETVCGWFAQTQISGTWTCWTHAHHAVEDVKQGQQRMWR